MNFCWCTITTGRLDESVRFYTELVGLTIARRFQMPGREFVFLIDEKGNEIELIFEGENPSVTEKPGISVGFTTGDLDKAMELAASMGYPIEGPVSPAPNVRFAFVTDPNGVKIQFVQNL